MSTAFKQTIYQHKWLVTHITFSDKLDFLYSYLTSGWDEEVSDGHYTALYVVERY